MAKDICFESLQEKFKNLKPREIQAILDEMENLRSRVFAQGEDPSSAAFLQKAVAFVNERRYQASAARREAAENMLKRQRNFRLATQDAFKGAPHEALIARALGGETKATEAGNLSAARIASDLRNSWTTQLRSGLLEVDLNGLMETKAIDREVAQAVWEMRPGGNLNAITSPQARSAAKVIRAVNRLMLKAKQAAGSSVRELGDYITKSTHDAQKIREAGIDKWAVKLTQTLDMERTFGDLPPAKIRETLQSIYDDIISGRRDSNEAPDVSDQFLTVRGLSPNLSKQTSRHRTLHFKDGYSWHDYNVEFGSKGLLESVLSDINRSSRQTALMQIFGTNPEGGFQALKSMLQTHYKREGNEAAAEKLNDWRVKAAYDIASGLTDIPGTGKLARALQTARTWQALSKLGNAWFSSFNDLAAAAWAHTKNSESNVFTSAATLVPEYLNFFKSAGEREKWAKRLDILIDDHLGGVYAAMGAPDIAPGKLSRAMRMYSRVTLMTAHVQSAKVAMAKQFAMELADHAEKSFTDLPAHIQDNLRRYGITEETWKVMNRGVQEFEDQRFLTPEGIRSIPDELFPGGAKAKFDAETKLLAYLNDHADIASSTPGARQKLYTTLGLPEDHWAGAMARVMTQFMSVPLFVNNTISRNSKGDALGLVQFGVLAMAMGYVGNTAREAWQGKKPRDPKEFSTIRDAFLRSGFAGVYGDYIVDEYTSESAGNMALRFAGPTLGEGFKGAEIGLDAAKKALNGGKSDVSGRALKFAIRNTPGSNVFWAKAALDQAFLLELQEWASPGTLRRMESRTRKQGQSYLFNRPTEAGR